MESWLPEGFSSSIFCFRTAGFKGGGLKNSLNGKMGILAWTEVSKVGKRQKQDDFMVYWRIGYQNNGPFPSV